MSPLDRRQFLTTAAAAASAAALGVGCAADTTTSGPGTTAGRSTSGTRPLPDPASAPFDTVVVLMMENRSFDHILGWLPGADGKQAGLTYRDAAGAQHATYGLAPDWQGCGHVGPDHDVPAMRTQWNDGANDGFLLTQPEGDLYPIGYYTGQDLPILAALAQGYTACDNYFASVMGPTWPNRLYQLCATTDVTHTGTFPRNPSDPRPSQLQTTIFDRAKAAGLSAGYYAIEEPMTGLFASKRYDDISYPFEQFVTDAAAGKLPNICFVDPDFAIEELIDDLTNSMHPSGSVQVGDVFLGEVHDILAKSPQWERLVAVINFDEGGGFFDHVAPPRVQDDTVLPADIEHKPDLTILGGRVPAIAVGPYAPARVDHGGPYEHCSILKMVEWRWGLEPMTLRDRTANNLAATLDFTTARDPISLPKYGPEPVIDCRQR